MIKKSCLIMGHATSIALEKEFWDALLKIAQLQNLSLRQLIIKIDSTRTTSLASSLRVYVLDFYQQKISEYQQK